MYKFVATLSLMLVVSFTTQAQSIMDLFKSQPSKSEEVKPERITHRSLDGRWSYAKLAVGLSDESSLKGAFGDIAISQVENLLNSLSSNAGISPNMFTVTFDESGAVEVSFDNDKSVNSTYVINPDQNRVILNIGEIGDINVGTLSAIVTVRQGRATLLFNAKRLFMIADKIPSISSDSQYQTIKGVVSNFDGVLLGFGIKSAHIAE